MSLHVLPALYAPADVHVSEVLFRGARVWVNQARRTGPLRLIPDLSHDIVLTATGPVVTARTASVDLVPLARGERIGGVRLPVDATGITLDRTWTGWGAGASDPAACLAAAITTGAIAWRSNADVKRALELLQPGIRVPALALELRMSERTLRRRIRAALGVGPVGMARVIRLWHLIFALRGSRAADASTLAGFADQPHASREARALCGLTIGELSRMRLAE